MIKFYYSYNYPFRKTSKESLIPKALLSSSIDYVTSFI